MKKICPISSHRGYSTTDGNGNCTIGKNRIECDGPQCQWWERFCGNHSDFAMACRLIPDTSRKASEIIQLLTILAETNRPIDTAGVA